MYNSSSQQELFDAGGKSPRAHQTLSNSKYLNNLPSRPP